MSQHDPRKWRPLPGSVPAELSDDLPARQPAADHLPWVEGLVDAIESRTGQLVHIDVGTVTEAWLRLRLGQGAIPLLQHLERIRPAVSEASFAFILAGVAAETL